MHQIIAKTFGGLTRQYYVRQFIFGLIFPLFFFLFFSREVDLISVGMIIFVVVSTLLYPYARFVYEGMMSFILGENIFFVNAILLIGWKFATMVFCWNFALFIAPIGLAYLYYRHSKS